MLNSASLSLDQAPPISIPFRFFLTAPLFGLAAGLLMLVYGPDLLITRWSPMTLALTHLITLGMLTMVMCGALMQMLPVLAGSPLPQVVKVGGFVHIALSLGTVLLVVAFVGVGGIIPLLALLLLGLGFAVFIVAVSIALWRVKRPNMTIVGMHLATVGLFFTVVLGLVLASGLFGLVGVTSRLPIVETHLSWGILGWMGLLLVGVSYQVVPMFQVTPEYPGWMRHWLAPVLFVLLFGWGGLVLGWGGDISGTFIGTGLQLLIYIGFSLFSIQTLRLQKQRKRRIPDVTLMFWRVGMLVSIGCLFTWCVGQFIPAIGQSPRYVLFLGLGLLLGVAVAVVNGMLYKIVSFLSWFHLQNRQMALMSMGVQVPNMKQLIPDVASKRQYHFYVAALVVALGAVFWPDLLARPAGLLFVLSNLLLSINLVSAARRYRATYQAITDSAAKPSV